MTKKNYQSLLTFQKPFMLRGYKPVLPAGTYKVDIEEESVEGPSFTVSRHKQATLHLHVDVNHSGIQAFLTLDNSELDAALRREEASMHEDLLSTKTGPGRKATGRREHEGMLWICEGQSKDSFLNGYQPGARLPK